MPYSKNDSEEYSYSTELEEIMLRTAVKSIANGLNNGVPIDVDTNAFPEALREKRATFVTLNIFQQLRGCIGMLEASRPLIRDIAENAYSAAFEDPRFSALNKHEFDALDLHISILSPSEPLSFDSERDLLSKLQPGIDGLILSESHHRGTFLPSVWESLPTAEQFLQNLKRKAGLPVDYWSDKIRIDRYTTYSFGAPINQIQTTT